MKKVLIIGAGPAGRTAAYVFLTRGKDYEVTILEQSDSIGGISRTVVHNGNRMDIGGHRFFSKDPQVNAWWEERMPLQGKPALDDRILNREVDTAPEARTRKGKIGSCSAADGFPESFLRIIFTIIPFVFGLRRCAIWGL